jgi:hypothetical protein
MVGALNKLPIAISGIIFFAAERKTINIGSIISVIIGKDSEALSRTDCDLLINHLGVAFISGVVYSLAQIQQKKKKAISSPEGTPLTEAPSNTAITVK